MFIERLVQPTDICTHQIILYYLFYDQRLQQLISMGQTKTQKNTWTSRLLDWIGLKADSVKTKMYCPVDDIAITGYQFLRWHRCKSDHGHAATLLEGDS